MKQEFIMRKSFCEWFEKSEKRNKSKNGASRPYAEGISSLLIKVNNNYPDFEREYYNYAPALIAHGERILAKQLLACVYADVCELYKISKPLSYFRKYCKYLSKNKNWSSVKKHFSLSDEKKREVEEYLGQREVWICDYKLGKLLKSIARDKKPTFIELFNIRISSWGRPNFPLDAIKKIIGSKFMSAWTKAIRDNIEVYISERKEPISLKNVYAFDFHKGDCVYVVLSGSRHILLTPTPDDNLDIMNADRMEDVSIDHEYPLDFIVKNLKSEKQKPTMIEEVASLYENNPVFDANELRGIDIMSLQHEMDEIREATPYRLMQRGMNSSKSNSTSFLRYEKEKGYRKFIVVENVVDEITHKRYRVYFTDKDKTKRLEEQPQEQ